MPHLAINNPITNVMLAICSIVLLASTLIGVLAPKPAPISPFVLLGVAIVIVLLAVGVNILCALVVFPKQWRSKALDASSHIEKGGIILVLGCRVGTVAASFAEQVVRQNKAQDTKFIFVDKFTSWGHPYKPKKLLQVLTSIGIPQKNVVAYDINTKDSTKPSIAFDELPFATGSISLIISGNMLQCSTQKESMYVREMIRVLRPGGRIIISDPRLFWGALKTTVLATHWKHAHLESKGALNWIDVTKPDGLLEWGSLSGNARNARSAERLMPIESV